MPVETVEGAFIHPASRADLFKSKSFTENIITNIVKVCSPKKKFVVNDNDLKSIFYDVRKNPGQVLAMVINGYYIEVPVAQAIGKVAFWVVTEELGYAAESEFVGMREATFAQEGEGEKHFVYASSDKDDIPSAVKDNDDYIIVSPTGIEGDEHDIDWSSFYSWVLKTNVYSCFYVGDDLGEGSEPDHDKLWIVSNRHFITRVWVGDDETGTWVPLGAVYKSTQTT